MKRLFLLRHAKAVAGDADGEDFARELAPRGHEDAARMGEILRKRGSLPDLVLCSAARRTLETWGDVSRAFSKPPKIELVDTLYLAPASTILALLRAAPGRAERLLVIGHNPGLETLALHLVRKPKGAEAREHVRAMANEFPTCTLAVFDFAVSAWKDIAAGEGTLADFIRPKDLKAR